MMDKPYYLMFKSNAHVILPGAIGVVAGYEVATYLEDTIVEVWLLDKDMCHGFTSYVDDYIDVTSLIEFCLQHEMSAFDLYCKCHGRYKNICEVLIELDEKNLLSEAMKELPELFAEIMEDNHYVKHFCSKYMKGMKDDEK